MQSLPGVEEEAEGALSLLGSTHNAHHRPEAPSSSSRGGLLPNPRNLPRPADRICSPVQFQKRKTRAAPNPTCHVHPRSVVPHQLSSSRMKDRFHAPELQSRKISSEEGLQDPLQVRSHKEIQTCPSDDDQASEKLSSS